MACQKRPYLITSNIIEDFDKKVKWFQNRLIELLDDHAKIMQITAYFQQQQNGKVAEIGKSWVKTNKKFYREKILKVQLKQVWNLYYQTI